MVPSDRRPTVCLRSPLAICIFFLIPRSTKILCRHTPVLTPFVPPLLFYKQCPLFVNAPFLIWTTATFAAAFRFFPSSFFFLFPKHPFPGSLSFDCSVRVIAVFFLVQQPPSGQTARSLPFSYFFLQTFFGFCLVSLICFFI